MRPPLDPAEAEAAYERIVQYEAMVGGTGRDVRLARLAWERDQFLFRLTTNGAVDRVARASKPDIGAAKHDLPAAHDVEQRNMPPPPDSFRDSICPPPPEDDLENERKDLERRLARFNLSESAKASLDRELAWANGLAAQVDILRRRLAGVERAYAMSEAVTGHYQRASAERTSRSRQQPHSIAPWGTRR